MTITNDNINYNFEAIEKLMINYIIYFYRKYSDNGKNKLLQYKKDNIGVFNANIKKQADKITNKMKRGYYPDRHKIIAACLKSFVASRIFAFDKEEYKKLQASSVHDDAIQLQVLYPNEMYCIMIIKIIIDEYSKFKNIEDYRLIYANNIIGLNSDKPHNYVIDLFKLIMGYNKQSLDFVVQELAHILFFIEMGYEISVKGLKNNYYK